jgi:hypothetical protein
VAIGGGRISLPLAVGVDRGHPQWPNLFIFLFLCFFFWFAGKVIRGQRSMAASVCRRWAVGGDV